jgi:hypothetical protein
MCMKSLKVKLAMLAMVIGLGSAFATVKHHALSDRKWSRDASSGQYQDITGQTQGIEYDCDLASSVCTATYPEGQNPNSDASNPVSVETGVFN